MIWRPQTQVFLIGSRPTEYFNCRPALFYIKKSGHFYQLLYRCILENKDTSTFHVLGNSFNIALFTSSGVNDKA